MTFLVFRMSYLVYYYPQVFSLDNFYNNSIKTMIKIKQFNFYDYENYNNNVNLLNICITNQSLEVCLPQIWVEVSFTVCYTNKCMHVCLCIYSYILCSTYIRIYTC